MGVDKATLRWTDGRSLGVRQAAWLEAAGATEIIWALRPGQRRPPGCEEERGHRVVVDAVSEVGPLAGLAAGLAAARAPHVLVLAIDVPELPLVWAHRLVTQATPGMGAAAFVAAHWEPLAGALYPREPAAAAAQQALARSERVLQRWCDAAEAAGWLRRVPIGPTEQAWFRNVNTPADLPAGSSG